MELTRELTECLPDSRDPVAEAAEPMIPDVANHLMEPNPKRERSIKKGALARRVAVIAAAVLLLCGLAVGTLVILDRREPGVSAEKEPLCNTTDLNEFVEHWKATHTEQGMDFLVVPVCKTDRYRFVKAIENDYNYFYYFAPAGWVSGENAPSFYDVGIIVTLSKSDGSYTGVLDQFGLTDRNGRAYYERHDEVNWFINYGGHRLSVRFFNTQSLSDPEDFRTVTDLFEFLVFTKDNMPTLPEKETVAEPPVTDTP